MSVFKIRTLMVVLSFKHLYQENYDAMLGLPHSVSVVLSAVQMHLLAWQHFIVTAVLYSSTSMVPWRSLPVSANQSSAAVHLIEVTSAYSSRYVPWWQLWWSAAVAIQVLCYSVTARLRGNIAPRCRVPTQQLRGNGCKVPPLRSTRVATLCSTSPLRSCDGTSWGGIWTCRDDKQLRFIF